MKENSLISIWHKTREVVEERLEYGTKQQIFWLIVAFGIAFSLDNASIRDLGDKFSLGKILAISVFVGPIVGGLYWLIISLLLHWTSRLLGGTGTWGETRTAVAWSTTVYSAKLVLWIPQLFLFGHELFTSETPRIDSSLLLLTLFFLFGLLETALQIVFIIVLSISLGVAHRFSSWRGFGALVLMVAAVILLITLPIFLFS